MLFRKMIIISFVLFLLSCGITENKVNDFQLLVDSLVAFQNSEIAPEFYLKKEIGSRTGDIDINKYFEILPNIQIQPGYELDFIYKNDHPIIYAKRINDPQFKTIDQYINSFNGDPEIIRKNINNLYLNYVINDNSVDGYFQYLLLYLMGNQFYMYWHGLYNDETIICNNKGLEEIIESVRNFGEANESPIIEIPDNIIIQAKQIDYTPRIKSKKKAVEIRIVTFSKWKGFVEKNYSIKRSHPNVITKIESNMLLEFQSGMKF